MIWLTKLAVIVWEGLTNRQNLAHWQDRRHQRTNDQESIGTERLTSLESGAGWNWQCTWPAVAERTGIPKTSERNSIGPRRVGFHWLLIRPDLRESDFRGILPRPESRGTRIAPIAACDSVLSHVALRSSPLGSDSEAALCLVVSGCDQ
jgi:hypothetical protein